METLPETVRREAERADLFDGARRLLVGCSGGGDSTVLLDLLLELAPVFGLEFAVAHLNHGWRGEAADADEEFVRRLAAARGLTCFAERAELPEGTGSPEAAGRRARLTFFARCARDWPADAVALGHTADDQAETVLLNLVRGAGLLGLGGIKPRTRIGELLILRPLLSVRRDELREYATSRGLEWKEDASNDDISLARNRIRLRVLPELQEVNPRAVQNVRRTAEILQEEEDWHEERVEGSLRALLLDEEYPGGVALDREFLAGAPRALQRRVLRRALASVRGETLGLHQEHVDAVLESVLPGVEKARDLPGVRVVNAGDRLRLLPLQARQLKSPAAGPPPGGGAAGLNAEPDPSNRPANQKDLKEKILGKLPWEPQ